MRRMISFTPVAHGTINTAADKFELDNNLEKGGFYLIVIKERSYNESCCCFLKVADGIYYHRSTVFKSALSDVQPTALTFNIQHPDYLSIPKDSIPTGSTVEVIRIA